MPPRQRSSTSFLSSVYFQKHGGLIAMQKPSLHPCTSPDYCSPEAQTVSTPTSAARPQTHTIAVSHHYRIFFTNLRAWGPASLLAQSCAADWQSRREVLEGP